nr:MAG TPA: Putative TetR-family transcriptional regulator [Caudoviricetes sp.]
MKDKIYAYIVDCIIKNGYAPSMREIAADLNIVASTVHNICLHSRLHHQKWLCTIHAGDRSGPEYCSLDSPYIPQATRGRRKNILSPWKSKGNQSQGIKDQ